MWRVGRGRVVKKVWKLKGWKKKLIVIELGSYVIHSNNVLFVYIYNSEKKNKYR